MQCWNCEFENIPGLRMCARCGGMLNLEGVSVEPPRASRLRAATRLARVGHRVRVCVPDVSRLVGGLTFLLPEPVSWSALAWSFIPGLGHLKADRAQLGWCILVAWLLLLLLTLLSLGTSWAWLFRTGMIATHVVALVSLFAASLAYERLYVRAAFGLVLFLGLGWFLYQPVEWLCARFYVALPLPAVLEGDVIASGDGLIYEGPWLRPSAFARGDLVLYRIEASQQNNLIIRAGLGIDRVVGVPGDHVQVRDGVLLVNGNAPQAGQGPLGPVAPLGNFDLHVATGRYVIFPTRLALNLPGDPVRDARVRQSLVVPLSLVPHENVVGRVVFRVRPLSRFGCVE